MVRFLINWIGKTAITLLAMAGGILIIYIATSFIAWDFIDINVPLLVRICVLISIVFGFISTLTQIEK